MLRDYNLLFHREADNSYYFEFAKVQKPNHVQPSTNRSEHGGHRFFRAVITNRFAVKVDSNDRSRVVSHKPIFN